MSTEKVHSGRRKYKPVPDVSRKDPNVSPFDAILAKEQRTREALIAMEETKLLAEKVKECRRREGVNHYEKCEQIARAYLKRISTPGFKDSPVEMSDIE
ncbi:NADH dehydrogenase [ubiquinone] 1 beta subcomplex subunit 10-B [Gracilariopsis chorda]|uniref:NADH dehydrogenase [ubiquinone] 1 beta subcomplex subunit 10-B n=1 Tax=Gracilariopsis chorda TaxID=448386 RepID=A0A2V3IN78_9FLOR|nr:NADH dehydrogenase [ubiquinone] 1 beta subcomplex subunit 10-B [Gracilariopsis chorda]|eukprot:PXF43499.1 NADH dehydrogenase [ubiquinone] 1 beta subcomplex subunit 10-B [Gracilariopsis chorda]